ncbi:MAG TPA: alpha/beta hydrolase [Gammaproteobacteria bacterium]|jgi:proline iminopeptidase|nr:alpha/beta hydrolase [Gammaproteobacteria bacterium]
MKIKIPQRVNAPETSLWVEVIMQDGDFTSLGKGRSVMLLVPGGPGGNHTVYDEIKAELLKYADLILFDPRGCGLSDSSEAQFCTIDHYRDDIEAIRENFGLKKIILFGGSYGSMASLGYAVKYQSRLEKLILSGGAPSFRFIELAKQNLKERGTEEQILAGEKLFNGGFKSAQEFEEFYKILAPLYVYKFQQQEPVPSTKSKIPYNVDVTNLGFGGFLAKFNYEPYLECVNCDTLIIFGKNDWINDPFLAILMAEKIRHSKLVLLDKCGHFIWRDQKEKYFAALKDFLSSTMSNENVLSSGMSEEKQYSCKL